jgi:low affinity Fe/Cu permease
VQPIKPSPRASAPLERFAQILTHWAGSTPAFVTAVAIIVIWASTGWLFDYGDTWQLVINTSTTIVTFLMVFLIQRSQNKDSLALHVKLNELIAALHGASNRLINVEDLSEAELAMLHEHYSTLAAMAKRERSLVESHSVEEAGMRHRGKQHRHSAP